MAETDNEWMANRRHLWNGVPFLLVCLGTRYSTPEMNGRQKDDNYDTAVTVSPPALAQSPLRRAIHLHVAQPCPAGSGRALRAPVLALSASMPPPEQAAGPKCGWGLAIGCMLHMQSRSVRNRRYWPVQRRPIICFPSRDPGPSLERSAARPCTANTASTAQSARGPGASCRTQLPPNHANR